MSRPEFLSVPDAARELGVNASRVRALLAGGQLDGIKLGGRWLVPWSAVRERRNTRPARGRSLVPANAWGVLALASGEQPDWISRDERRRLVRLLEARGFAGLVPRLRERAALQRFYAHPGILRELAEAPDVVAAGVSAARRHRLRLVPGEEVEAYVAARRLQPVIERMVLERRDEGANVRLRVIPDGFWPFHERFAPKAAVALDLAELPDARAQRIGRAAIHELEQERRWRVKVGTSSSAGA
jgi:hypothetical protein